MINTAPEGARNSTSPVTAQVLRRVLNRWRNGLGEAYVRGRKPWQADKAVLVNGTDVDLRGARVLRLCPAPASHNVERLTVLRAELLDGARAGFATTMRAFGHPSRAAYFSITLDPAP
jgi:hypothetical protein